MYEDYREKYIKDLQKENASLREDLKSAKEQRDKAISIAKEFVCLYFAYVLKSLGYKDSEK